MLLVSARLALARRHEEEAGRLPKLRTTDLFLLTAGDAQGKSVLDRRSQGAHDDCAPRVDQSFDRNHDRRTAYLEACERWDWVSGSCFWRVSRSARFTSQGSRARRPWRALGRAHHRLRRLVRHPSSSRSSRQRAARAAHRPTKRSRSSHRRSRCPAPTSSRSPTTLTTGTSSGGPIRSRRPRPRVDNAATAVSEAGATRRKRSLMGRARRSGVEARCWSSSFAKPPQRRTHESLWR